MADEDCSLDPMVICPLDKSHQIRKCRLIFHLVKCKKNHDLSKKATCMFNGTHIVDKSELKTHYLTCTDRYEQQEIQYETDEEEKKRWQGILSVKDVVKAQEQSPTDGENWDDDPPVSTYDPYEATVNRGVARTLMVASKSVKRAWRQSEKQKIAEFDRNRGYSKVNTPKGVQVKTSSKPLPTGKTITTVSCKENGKVVNQVQTKIQNPPTVADQLVTNLKLLDISNKPKNLNIDDFPALQSSKSFSGAVKKRNPSEKQQRSKKINSK